MTKTILVTGASSGFGRLTAETLARAGYHVFGGVRRPNTKNRGAVRDLAAANVKTVDLDVTDERSVKKAVAAVVSETGGIDVLVNNAGVASAGVTEAFTPEQATALFDVNVFGVHRVSRAVLPQMRARKDGLIINIGSILGRVTFPFFGLYGASKYAVEALTDSYRYELSQLGVDVCLIQPSAYPTQMYASADQPSEADRVRDYGAVGEIPGAMMNQFGEMLSGAEAPNPQDVARAVAELVAAEKGARAERVVVGASFGADAVNDAVKPIQAQVVDGLGLGHLSTLKTD